MDAVDNTQKTLEQLEELRRKNRADNIMEAEPTGYCLNCGNMDILKGMRWCNSACRDDWTKRRGK